jgi:hypothetical protein
VAAGVPEAAWRAAPGGTEPRQEDLSPLRLSYSSKKRVGLFFIIF